MAGRYPIWFSTVRHPRVKIGLQIFEKSRAETFCYLTFALKFPAFSYKMHHAFTIHLGSIEHVTYNIIASPFPNSFFQKKAEGVNFVVFGNC